MPYVLGEGEGKWGRGEDRDALPSVSRNVGLPAEKKKTLASVPGGEIASILPVAKEEGKGRRTPLLRRGVVVLEKKGAPFPLQRGGTIRSSSPSSAKTTMAHEGGRARLPFPSEDRVTSGEEKGDNRAKKTLQQRKKRKNSPPHSLKKKGKKRILSVPDRRRTGPGRRKQATTVSEALLIPFQDKQRGILLSTPTRQRKKSQEIILGPGKIVRACVLLKKKRRRGQPPTSSEAATARKKKKRGSSSEAWRSLGKPPGKEKGGGKTYAPCPSRTGPVPGMKERKHLRSRLSETHPIRSGRKGEARAERRRTELGPTKRKKLLRGPSKMSLVNAHDRRQTRLRWEFEREKRGHTTPGEAHDGFFSGRGERRGKKAFLHVNKRKKAAQRKRCGSGRYLQKRCVPSPTLRAARTVAVVQLRSGGNKKQGKKGKRVWQQARRSLKVGGPFGMIKKDQMATSPIQRTLLAKRKKKRNRHLLHQKGGG